MKQILIICLTLLIYLASQLLFAQATETTFAGYTWRVKNGTGLGPGPNNWSDSTTKIWVDDSGSLHLTISTTAGNATKWYCTELDGPSLGYGTYFFHTQGRPDNFDKNMVAATFLYASDSQELDIERSYWGGTTTGNSATDLDFAVQTGNGDYVNFYPVHQGSNPSGDTTNITQVITWAYHTALFQMYYGYQTWGSLTVGNADTVAIYLNTTSWVPLASSNLTTDINFWLYQGHAPATGQGAEWTITDFTFYPNDLTGGGYFSPAVPVELSIFEVASAVSDRKDDLPFNSQDSNTLNQ
jgi:hypothetical protein